MKTIFGAITSNNLAERKYYLVNSSITSFKTKNTLLRLQLSLIGGANEKKRSETTSFFVYTYLNY
ncbi:hypothetical protein SAMN05421761_1237 [Belliella pelovolcani]|uniref:Uncharacterized protein n=1 Tax=Belliella pelovolcani TaxID=529505 RepID=A0A1N7PYK5_9BACT|nr:hypothetical protein SAMN05421761_1237 [Belliella pelovolcani]